MAEQEENWCWCNKCQGLFYAGNPTVGVCPAGGGHDSSGSVLYSLTYGGSSGQQEENWCSCSKCEGLFYAGNPTVGVCPAGGGHDSSGSADYSLNYGGSVGQQDEDWRWCNKCEGLFYAGPEQPLGVCPAGGQHDSSGSENYSLTYNDLGQSTPSPDLPSLSKREEQPSSEAPPNSYEQSPSGVSDPGGALSLPSPSRRRFKQIMGALGFVLLLVLSVWSIIGRLTENPVISIRFRAGGPRLFGLLFMGIGLILAVIGLVVFINTRNFLQGTVAGQGRIASCQMQTVTYSDGSVSYVCQPTVYFTTAYGKEVHFVSSDSSSSFHVGDNVPVRYHPDHPQDAVISSFSDLWLAPIILGGLAGVFFLIGLVFVLLTRRG